MSGRGEWSRDDDGAINCSNTRATLLLCGTKRHTTGIHHYSLAPIFTFDLDPARLSNGSLGHR